MKHPGEVIQSFLLLLSLIYDEYLNWPYILFYWGWGWEYYVTLLSTSDVQTVTVLEFVTRSVGELGDGWKGESDPPTSLCVCDDDDDDDDDSRIGASRTSIYKEG